MNKSPVIFEGEEIGTEKYRHRLRCESTTTTKDSGKLTEHIDCPDGCGSHLLISVAKQSPSYQSWLPSDKQIIMSMEVKPGFRDICPSGQHIIIDRARKVCRQHQNSLSRKVTSRTPLNSIIVWSYSRPRKQRWKTVIMGFPTEVVSMSLQHLNKSDLKNARLVSKQWSGCASEFLFTKLFVSPHSLNLEGFVTIAQDPRLSKCVKELEYDAVHFSPHLTISEYFKILWRQTGIITYIQESGLEKYDPEIHCYLNFRYDLRQNPRKSDEIMANAWSACSGFTFIQRGYWKWMEEAHLEQECTDPKTFLKTLISGLQNLTRLETVKLRGSWPSRAKLSGQGSRLARTWNLFYARPGDIFAGSDFEAVKAVQDFRNLAFALSKARVTGVRNLSIECTLPPPAFRSYLDRARGFMCAGVSAFARVDNLKLSLPGRCASSFIDYYFDLYKVSPMLGSMTTLKRLDLELPEDRCNNPVFYVPYSVVFPKHGHWPQLTTLTVQNLAIGTKNLVTLFIKKMPSVRHLAFGRIYLDDGTWEGIFEFLRILHRLSSFSIDPESFLLLVKPRFRTYQFNDVQSIMDYIINRQDGRPLKHPGLLPDEPAHYALEYMAEVSRLCGFYENDGTQEALDKLIQEETTRYSTQQNPTSGTMI